MRQIVSHTGPLILLAKLSQGYDFIRRLYDKLIIAPVVLEEAAAGQFATPDEYLQHYNISDLIKGDHHNFKHPESRFVVTIVHPQKDVPVGRAVDTVKKIRLEVK